MQRKRRTPDFHANVALEALKGTKTINEIASEMGIHATQITQWKKPAQEGINEIFADRRGKAKSQELAGEKLITAEKDTQKIAVEIKSFISPSEIRDLEMALGQYVLYQNILSRIDPERTLYLAIREASFLKIFEQEVGKILLENKVLKLFTFNPDQEVITRWIA